MWFSNGTSFKEANTLCFHRKKEGTNKAACGIILYKYKHKNVFERKMLFQGLSTDRKSMNENKFLSHCPGLKAEKKKEREKERKGIETVFYQLHKIIRIL